MSNVNVAHIIDDMFTFQKVSETTVGDAMASLPRKKSRDKFELNPDIVGSVCPGPDHTCAYCLNQPMF
jgi:hypothetical protein